MFDRRPDRARWTGRRLLCPEVRIDHIELPHLAIGSPTQVAVARLPQIHMRKIFETARRVETRGEFVADRFVVDEAVRACRADGLFIEAHCIEVAALEASNLGAHERGAVLEILRASLLQYLELLVMRKDGTYVLLPFAGCCGVAASSVRKRAVEVAMRGKEQQSRQRMPLRPRCCLDGRGIVAGMIVRLQFLDPVKALRKRQV